VLNRSLRNGAEDKYLYIAARLHVYMHKISTVKYYFILNTWTTILSRQKNGMAEAIKLSGLEVTSVEGEDETDGDAIVDMEDAYGGLISKRLSQSGAAVLLIFHFSIQGPLELESSNPMNFADSLYR